MWRTDSKASPTAIYDAFVVCESVAQRLPPDGATTSEHSSSIHPIRRSLG